MALSLRGTAENSHATGGDVTITHPVGTAADDVVFLAYSIGSASDQDMQVSTSGYAELADIYSDDTFDINLGVFWKKMPGTPDSTAVVVGSGGALDPTAAVEQVWTGADTSTPIDATTTTDTGIDSAVPDSPAIDTVTANAVVLSIGAGSIFDEAVTAPSGYSDTITETNRGSGGGEYANCLIASKLVVSPGTENPAAWTDVSTATNRAWCAATVAIRPATTAFSVDATAGSYTLTGVTAGALAGRVLLADPGSHTLTGVAALLARSLFLDAAVGSYTLTGTAADLLAARAIAADPGAYTLAGVVADLLADRVLAAGVGSHALTGFAADLLATRVIVAGSGTYVVTGAAASLVADRMLDASPGAYLVTGAAADLIRAGVSFELLADPGTYVLSGVNAELLADRLVAASPGTYTLTGASADLTVQLIAALQRWRRLALKINQTGL